MGVERQDTFIELHSCFLPVKHTAGNFLAIEGPLCLRYKKNIVFVYETVSELDTAQCVNICSVDQYNFLIDCQANAECHAAICIVCETIKLQTILRSIVMCLLTNIH